MRAGVWFAVALAGSLALSPPAGAQISQHYIKLCDAGEYAVGLHAGVGSWVNRVQAMCAKWDGKTGTFGPPHEATSKDTSDFTGGDNGGRNMDRFCQYGSQNVLVGVHYGHAHTDNGAYAQNVHLICAYALNPVSANDEAELSSDSGGPDGGSDCPPGQLGIGLDVTADVQVHDIYMKYAAQPTMIAPSASTSKWDRTRRALHTVPPAPH
jgi:hypothetical protein